MTTSTQVTTAAQQDVLTMEQALKLKGKKAIDFFCNIDNVQPLIDFVKKEALSQVPDLTTKKGRDAIGTNARKVSSSKKLLEDAVKAATTDAQLIVDNGKSVKKHVAESLEQVRKDVLKPRDEWKAEQERIEQERISAIRERINNITALGNVTGKEDKDELGIKIDAIKAMDVSDGFGELTQEAVQAKESAIQNLNDAVSAIIQKEIEEENARKLAEEQEKLAAQQRDTEITARIQKLQGIPFAMFNSTAKEVQDKLDALNKHKPTAEDFGERHQEAVTAFDGVVDNLTQLLGQKQQMEAMQAQQEDKVIVDAVVEDIKQEPGAFELPESEQAVFNDVIADAQASGTGAMIVSEEGVKHVPQEDIKHEACTSSVKSDTCRGCPDCPGKVEAIPMDETEKAKEKIKSLMPTQYSAYIDNYLAGDFAYHLAKLL